MEKTVVRAGYGLSYIATFTTAGTQGFSQSTPYIASNDGNIHFAGNYPRQSLSGGNPDALRQQGGAVHVSGAIMSPSRTPIA